MGNFFYRLRARFRQFMTGRYGSDNLSRFMLAIAFVCMFLNIFLGSKTWIFAVLVWLFLILVYLRMFSRNIQARYNENTRYLMLKEKVVGFFRGKGSRGSSSQNTYQDTAQTHGTYRSDAEHRIFRCPSCNQRVRVPRGRGKIEITCPRCGNHFKKRS